MSKKLAHAPIYYALIQAQFNPVAAMANYINEIQDKLRLAGYTLFDMQKVTQLHLETLPAQHKATVVEIPVWRFTNSDRKSGFILNQSQLVYHTTHYETHGTFFDAFLLGLEIVHSIIKLDHMSRLGLRYLNAVLPSTDEIVNQYLISGLHGVCIDATSRYSLLESVYNTTVEPNASPGTLVNRVLCRSSPLGYPPDLTPPDLLQLAKFSTANTTSHAVIDIDHFTEVHMSLNIKGAKIKLTSLHAGIKQAFEATITDYAKKVWA